MLAAFMAEYATETDDIILIEELDSFGAIEVAAAEAHAEAAALMTFPEKPAPADPFSFDSMEWE